MNDPQNIVNRFLILTTCVLLIVFGIFLLLIYLMGVGAPVVLDIPQSAKNEFAMRIGNRNCLVEKAYYEQMYIVKDDSK